jgi:hypothetical protein
VIGHYRLGVMSAKSGTAITSVRLRNPGSIDNALITLDQVRAELGNAHSRS